MKHFFKIILITFSIGSIFSCGTKKVQAVPASTPLLIETKAQIKSLDESHNVKIDIALSPNRMIRLEVTATLGYRVATVLMNPQRIQYALHTNKTFYEGPFSARTMYPIFKQAIDPRIIWRVVHGQSPQSPQLICQTDENQKPILCTGPDSLMVKWTYEEAPKKRIQIKNNQFEMTWIFKDQTILNQSQTETFVLKKPEGYKEIVLK